MIYLIQTLLIWLNYEYNSKNFYKILSFFIYEDIIDHKYL